MIKKLITFAIMICVVSCFAVLPTMASANNASTSADMLTNFLSACPTRTAGTESAKSTADYIQTQLESFGVDSVQQQPINGSTLDYNVIATLSAPNATQTVVVGAHHDTVSGEGANDNACGVVALMQLAKALVQNKQNLNFNVQLVAFGCEESGMLGSKQFVASLTQAQKDALALMVNIDVIASGDNLYVLCENKQTPLLDTILQASKGAPCQVVAKPFSKGVYALNDPFGYGYWEMAQNSDQTPFRVAGIATALFFSGNYKGLFYGYVESNKIDNWTMNGTSDTLANLIAHAPQYASRIDTVVQTATNLLIDDAHQSVVADAKNHLVSKALTNRLYGVVVAMTIVVLSVVGVVLYHNKLKKQSLLGVKNISESKQTTPPDANDIFKF